MKKSTIPLFVKIPIIGVYLLFIITITYLLIAYYPTKISLIPIELRTGAIIIYSFLFIIGILQVIVIIKLLQSEFFR